MYRLDAPKIELKSTTLDSGLYIWVWNPEKKSPHIGISFNGAYFSLHHASKQEAISYQKVLSVVNRKSISLLILKIQSELNVEDVAKEFSSFTSCDENNCSCSRPILNLFGIQKEEGLLFDLLDKLTEYKMIRNQIHINIEDSFEGIPFYAYDDVRMNLEKFSV